jgi:UDP-glucuronate 4-epimerase
MGFVKAIEDVLSVETENNLREMQPGDVYQTFAEVNDLFDATGYKSKVSVAEGVAEFIKWYKGFYQK